MDVLKVMTLRTMIFWACIKVLTKDASENHTDSIKKLTSSCIGEDDDQDGLKNAQNSYLAGSRVTSRKVCIAYGPCVLQPSPPISFGPEVGRDGGDCNTVGRWGGNLREDVRTRAAFDDLLGDVNLLVVQ